MDVWNVYFFKTRIQIMWSHGPSYKIDSYQINVDVVISPFLTLE